MGREKRREGLYKIEREAKIEGLNGRREREGRANKRERERKREK